MPSKGKMPIAPPPATPDRQSSPELGSPSRITSYNKKTGRPVRKSAGKIQKVAGYVDFEDDEFGPLTTDESEEEEEDDMEPRGRADKGKNKNKRMTKRKRSPSPPSPHLEPLLYDQELDELTDNEEGGAFHRHTPKKPPMTLQFNVPLGFHGPLFVKIDSSMLQTNEAGKLHEMQPGKSKKVCTKSRQSQPDKVLAARPKGFTDLPAELRNTIYRYLFARNDDTQELRIPVNKQNPKDNLCKSAQFLRTCKLVHNEGCSVLYGENTFSFKRHYGTRGPFWEAVPKEVGYQDVLHFLKMIGPENLQYLRDIKFVFDDASPRHTSYVESNEKRRYLNDEYLMNCLRILREAKLRKVSMFFGGRRQLQRSDVKFLGYLEQVKADEVDRIPDRYFSLLGKISNAVWADLEEAMTRKKKLYEDE
ncbi:hypothetical protein L13192_00356 [Pyrenophora tritici-repentis]|uniref:Uncharacterized protein n=2 Tax=Pyrenophora tritici-repentis TaxID=45151 RepID=A0A922NLD3_9PLEO|nr:uncharacterized protein PTRG_02139 [Pyrenophora tritici-repentis Pt-1C-BFP]EDU41577.1 conserved hypothetical protein [Pyrenophora tritici-repentis Pt-1C-BFP]KAI1517830.1 hypothetical protein Ptr86124_003131 [Pyrenophora tritici-repentis]KAI1673609.1 hypothetical protein L13192_00356 [Pyrenophora tritici-repentis]KAI1689348.1 hypothetical protein KJE20_02526 [Pyrenophora tritici-repentis]